MKLVRLGDVADINPRVTAELKARPDSEIAFLPMDAVGEDGTIRYQERRLASSVLSGYTLFKRNDVVLAKITPCMENGKAAHLEQLVSEYGAGSTEFHVLRPGSKLDGRFLYYLIWNPKFREAAEKQMTGSAGQKRVPADFLRSLEFLLPHIDEQRRIASILSKANSICRKTKWALSQTDQLLRSAFLEMFGDINARKTKFAPSSLRGLVDALSGKSSKDVISSVQTEFPIYGGNGINGWAVRPLYKEPVIVVGRVGQQCGITRLTAGASWVTDNAIVVRVEDSNRLNYDYIEMALQMSSLRATVEHLDLPFITQKILLDYPLPIPPMPDQQRFSVLKKKVLALKEKSNLSVSGWSDAFTSLSQRAFRGEL